MSRVAALAAALIVLSFVTPVAAAAAGGAQAGVSAVDDSSTVAQTANNTTEPTEDAPEWEAPGPFSLDELRTGGEHPSEAPPSVRYLRGDTGGAVGAVAFRYVPASPFENEPKMLEPGTTLNGDRVQIYSTIFGEAAGEYEFTVVFWQNEQKTVNGTTVNYAANQEVQRATVDIENGYATADIKLQSHFQDTYQATAWLEKDGERVPGARWRFKHASLPTAQQVQIATQADAWWYTFRTAILPGAAGIILGLSLARMTLRRVGRGPGYGLGAWVILGALGGSMVLGGLYYEVSVLIANADILMGLSLGVIAYGGGLRMHPPTEKIQFVRKELQEAKALRRGTDGQSPPEDGDVVADGGQTPAAQNVVQIPEDSYKDNLYEDIQTVEVVRGEQGRNLVKKGIGPFFARLFADGALLDLSAIRTRVRVAKGSVNEKVFTDPEGNNVEHTPARLARRWPVWHRLPELEGDEEHDLGTKAFYGAFSLGAMALPYVGWQIAAQTLNAPLIGATVGALVLAVESYGAKDGSIEFEPAPRHFVSADASLTVLQNEHSDAKMLEDFEEIAWQERSRTALEARSVEARRDKSITQSMNERALGMDLGVLGLDGQEEDVDDLDLERNGDGTGETSAEADDD